MLAFGGAALFPDSGIGEYLYYAFFATFAIGIPASVGVAVLRYRLYDLDLVVKKAVVFAVLVVLLFALGSAVVLVASTPVFERIGDTPTLVAAVGDPAREPVERLSLIHI